MAVLPLSERLHLIMRKTSLPRQCLRIHLTRILSLKQIRVRVIIIAPFGILVHTIIFVSFAATTLATVSSLSVGINAGAWTPTTAPTIGTRVAPIPITTTAAMVAITMIVSIRPSRLFVVTW